MRISHKIVLGILTVGMVSVATVFVLPSPVEERHTVSTFFITEAVAAPSCSTWNRQPNGCDWRTCVDDNGSQYCVESCPGQGVSRVRC